MPDHHMIWRKRYSSNTSRKAGGRIISESTVVGNSIGRPVIALSVTAFIILDCCKFQRAPPDESFDLRASSSAHLTFTIPTQASSSRSERSALNLRLPSSTTSSERNRGKVIGCDLSLLWFSIRFHNNFQRSETESSVGQHWERIISRLNSRWRMDQNKSATSSIESVG